MDISKSEINVILGIVEGQRRGRVVNLTPLTAARNGMLQDYIIDHELNSKYINSQGEAFIVVNRKLVELSTGSGFGELALMSDIKRMASIRTITYCSLATLNRANFSICLRKA